MTKPVAIVMGSDSDLPVMRGAKEVLDEFAIGCTLAIVSAHRTPQRLHDFGLNAASDGYRVIIAGAGGAAHLPGMVASLTALPVIGVPISATKLNGLDALLSIVQMPAGVPVATMAVDNARNAGVMAAQILGVADPALQEAVERYKAQLAARTEEKAARLASEA